MDVRRRIQPFRAALLGACRRVYGNRLAAVALFGSWARGTATPASDLDVLIVARDLPPSRRKRVAEFDAVERDTAADRRLIWADFHAASELSPVIKTPEEMKAGSPLFLDMTECCDILWDGDRVLREYLDGLRKRLAELGARRRPRKGGYYWQYKPDRQPSEVVTL